MYSVILKTATKYLTPLMLLFAFFLLLRGHNEPGGGFVGGLVTAAAYALMVISYGVKTAQKELKYAPLSFIILGLSIALLSGIPALFVSETYLTGLWTEMKFPVIGKLGTPLIFDIGVFFLVIGITTKIIFTLAEEDQE